MSNLASIELPKKKKKKKEKKEQKILYLIQASDSKLYL
jgi:hypothetical protein